MVRYLSQFWFFSGMLAMLALAGTAVNKQTAVAQTGAAPPVPGSPSHPCHSLTSAQSIPQGFGAAYNLFSVAKEVLIAATCEGTSANITLGSGAQTQYIHKEFYRWDGSAWVPREWRQGGKLVDGTWYVGSASDILNSTGETDYFVAYICQWINNAWKCGCRDTSCTTNHWQLQAFRSEGASGRSTPSGDFPAINDCSGAKQLSGRTSNLNSLLSSAGNCAVITLSPATYSSQIDLKDRNGITIRCTTDAVSNGRGNNSGCRVKRIVLDNSNNIIIDKIVFNQGGVDGVAITTDANNILIANSYFGENNGTTFTGRGISTYPRTMKNIQIMGNTIYNSVPQPNHDRAWEMDYGIFLSHKGDTLVSGNQLIGAHNHSISLKKDLDYVEIVGNHFVGCGIEGSGRGGLCVELGQQGSFIRPNGSLVNQTLDRSDVHGNTFKDVGNVAIVIRDIATVNLKDNTFDSSNVAIKTWPYWSKWIHDGCSTSSPCMMAIPNSNVLTTNIVNNFFKGSNIVVLEGRGHANDTVNFSGNTGSFSCQKANMSQRAIDAHGNEQTTSPPRITGTSC